MEPLAVPAKEGIGFDVHQGATPREHASQNNHNQPRGIVGPVWLHLALFEKGELLESLGFVEGIKTIVCFYRDSKWLEALEVRFGTRIR
jgi:hypothetical protein